MPSSREEARRRLSELSSRSKQGSAGMDIPSIVEAVLGRVPERELIFLVEAAFESNGTNPIMESEMVDGILAIQEWKRSNS